MSRRHTARTTTPHTCVCGRPTTDTYVCQTCMDRYHGQLAAIPSLVADLELEHARLTRKQGTNTPTRGRTTTPVPFSEAASNALANIHATLTAACNTLTTNPPNPTIPTMTTWLAEHEPEIPLHPEGPTIVTTLDTTTQAALRICDTPPEKILRGRCPCNTELHAPRTAHHVHCPGCGTTWDGNILDHIRDNAIRDYLATREELITYATTTLHIPRRTIRTWLNRKQIPPTTTNLYRIGDLLTLHTRHQHHNAS